MMTKSLKEKQLQVIASTRMVRMSRRGDFQRQFQQFKKAIKVVINCNKDESLQFFYWLCFNDDSIYKDLATLALDWSLSESVAKHVKTGGSNESKIFHIYLFFEDYKNFLSYITVSSIVNDFNNLSVSAKDNDFYCKLWQSWMLIKAFGVAEFCIMISNPRVKSLNLSTNALINWATVRCAARELGKQVNPDFLNELSDKKRQEELQQPFYGEASVKDSNGAGWLYPYRKGETLWYEFWEDTVSLRHLELEELLKGFARKYPDEVPGSTFCNIS